MCISIKYNMKLLRQMTIITGKTIKQKDGRPKTSELDVFGPNNFFFPIVLLNENADVVTLKAWGLVMYPQKSSSSTLPSWSEQRLSCTFRYNTEKKLVKLTECKFQRWGSFSHRSGMVGILQIMNRKYIYISTNGKLVVWVGGLGF